MLHWPRQEFGLPRKVLQAKGSCSWWSPLGFSVVTAGRQVNGLRSSFGPAVLVCGDVWWLGYVSSMAAAVRVACRRAAAKGFVFSLAPTSKKVADRRPPHGFRLAIGRSAISWA